MRFLLLGAVALLPQASAAAPNQSAPAAAAPGVLTAIPTATKECRQTTSYRADGTLDWRGDKVAPKKLTELPPGTAYMAVYRMVNGCEEPLTVVEYRRFRR